MDFITSQIQFLLFVFYYFVPVHMRVDSWSRQPEECDGSTGDVVTYSDC